MACTAKAENVAGHLLSVSRRRASNGNITVDIATIAQNEI
jgi:hypothetical protein